MDPLKIFLYSLGFIFFLVLTQDLHIFPGALISKIQLLWKRKEKLPPLVRSNFIESKDSTSIEVWQYPQLEQTRLSDYVAIIFHGNGGPMQNFLFVQMWLAELGIKSFNFDYRGYGRSSGWPTEKGIYLDGDAVLEHVLAQESIDPSKIIIIGISIGSAPAARAAAKYSPKLLLLTSAFTDLRNTVREQPILGLLWPFVWHKFPTIDYVRELVGTDLLLAHGMKDNIVPANHAAQLESAYKGAGRVLLLTSEVAGHNMAFYALNDELRNTILKWL